MRLDRNSHRLFSRFDRVEDAQAHPSGDHALVSEITTAATVLAEFRPARFRDTAVERVNVGGGGLGNRPAPVAATLRAVAAP